MREMVRLRTKTDSTSFGVPCLRYLSLSFFSLSMLSDQLSWAGKAGTVTLRMVFRFDSFLLNLPPFPCDFRSSSSVPVERRSPGARHVELGETGSTVWL